MIIEQQVWSKAKGWSGPDEQSMAGKAQLVIVFAASPAVKEINILEDIKKMYPEAHLLGCSTAGEIYCTSVLDDAITATAIHFEKTAIRGAQLSLNNVDNSFEAGKMLAQSITHDQLRHVIVLSDGLNVNGSDLVKGLTRELPAGVTLTGGLAADGQSFAETYTFWDNQPAPNTLAILGLYGDSLKVGFGSMGGWDPFGPERVITRSKENILYDLDGQNALDIYKKYLGEHAHGLPAAALLFPLSIRLAKSGETGIVRTILSINETEKSMTFAGDIPQGAYARFMKANFERLIDGAGGAATRSLEGICKSPVELAILISCVGRKLVLKQRIEEEVEAARDALGNAASITGFYSYGEISPFMAGAACALHNQTMTITTFTEA